MEVYSMAVSRLSEISPEGVGPKYLLLLNGEKISKIDKQDLYSFFSKIEDSLKNDENSLAVAIRIMHLIEDLDFSNPLYKSSAVELLNLLKPEILSLGELESGLESPKKLKPEEAIAKWYFDTIIGFISPEEVKADVFAKSILIQNYTTVTDMYKVLAKIVEITEDELKSLLIHLPKDGVRLSDTTINRIQDVFQANLSIITEVEKALVKGVPAKEDLNELIS